MPVRIFSPGWTAETAADDYLARWRAPFNATGVIIRAEKTGRYDGIAQIDAVIVSTTRNPPDTPPAIVEPSKTPDQFSFCFATAPGQNYYIQSTDQLAALTWATIQTLMGDGSLVKVVDSRP